MKRNRKKLVVVPTLIAVVATNILAQPLNVDAAKVKVKAVRLNETKKEMYVGQKDTLKVKSVKPSNGTKAVTWKSSNKKIVAVSQKGKVTAKKAGTAVILATSKSNSNTMATCVISVSENNGSEEITDVTAVPEETFAPENTLEPTETPVTPSLQPAETVNPTLVPEITATATPEPTIAPTVKPTVAPITNPDDVQYKGTCGRTTWTIDKNGFLEVTGSGYAYYEGSDPGWKEYSEEIKSAKLSFSYCTYAQNMFAGCKNLETVDLSDFDTHSIRNMAGMFKDCKSLKEIDLSNFNTSNVKDMSYMFNGCKNLGTLNLSSFDTSKVTDMSYMFDGCTNLGTLELGNFNTSNVTNMKYMFNGCSGLTSLDVSGFNTSSVKDMSGMFAGCGDLSGSTLDVSNFDTSKVEDMGSMFARSGFKELDLHSFNIKEVRDVFNMFQDANAKKIVTPSATSGEDTYLPYLPTGGDWKDSDGNTYRKFPANKSITLTFVER